MSKKKVKISDVPEAENQDSSDGENIIQFIGKKEQLNKETGEIETVYREASTARRNGGRLIELPPATEQRKGFTHPDAEFLLTAYPREFKRKKSKGEK
jgi:hypothetical protein